MIDIREQYALLPVEETFELACQCGIRPPRKRGNEVTVVTTDFVITRWAQGREWEEAFTVKKAEDCSIYQIDSTPADVHLVSSLDPRCTIGRPTLYFVTDVFSG